MAVSVDGEPDVGVAERFLGHGGAGAAHDGRPERVARPVEGDVARNRLGPDSRREQNLISVLAVADDGEMVTFLHLAAQPGGKPIFQYHPSVSLAAAHFC